MAWLVSRSCPPQNERGTRSARRARSADTPDDVWSAFVRLDHQSRVVCLYCFDDFARERDVNYASTLKTVYFAGENGSLILSVVSARDFVR